jgi:hypothetical protein
VTIFKFLAALPALFRFFQTLAKRIEEAELDRKVHHDVKAIDDAFKTKNAAALDAIFNSK